MFLYLYSKMNIFTRIHCGWRYFKNIRKNNNKTANTKNITILTLYISIIDYQVTVSTFLYDQDKLMARVHSYRYFFGQIITINMLQQIDICSSNSLCVVKGQIFFFSKNKKYFRRCLQSLPRQWKNLLCKEKKSTFACSPQRQQSDERDNNLAWLSNDNSDIKMIQKL